MNIQEYIKKLNTMIQQSTSASTGYRNTHNILTITGIALSASAAGVLAIGTSIGMNLGLIIASVSCAIVSCVTLLVDRIYDFEAKAILKETIAKQLEQEKTYFELKTNIYKEDHQDIFVERCESIIHQ